MELGARLRQARLEAGLSQRQLCGQVITRNMLSQIENGSARPSMETLRYLADRLDKPMSYFLEEQAVTSPNQALMEQARNASGEQVLELLKAYREPDPTFDRERWLLEALACLQVAADALSQGKQGYCRTLLERCSDAGARTPYYTRALEKERLLLCFAAEGLTAAQFRDAFPTDDRELLLRCQAAMALEQWEQAQGYLLAVQTRTPQWHWYMGNCAMADKAYARARHHLTQAEVLDQRPIYQALEVCCRELEDYKMAYFYACKQKEQS